MVSLEKALGKPSEQAEKCETGTSRASDVIPARYILTLLTFFGMSLIFGQRVCLNVAMVAMVNSSAEEELPAVEEDDVDIISDNHCPMPDVDVNATLNYKTGSYPWTPSTQGIILSSYFYGYVVAQIVGGRMADIFGAKRLFGIATLLSSLMTCVTPVISALPPVWIILLRILLGLVHGMNYPSAYTLLSKWAPVQERSSLLSICVIGTHFGVVVSMPLTGYLCENGFQGGWPSAFYFTGAAGFVWFPVWWFLVFDSPLDHPRISTKELDYIQKNLGPVSDEKKKASVPWAKVICSPPVWAVTVAKFCGAWSFICFQSKLPAYLDEVLHLPIQKNGLVNAALFGALCCSIVLSGKVSDIIRQKGYFSTTTTLRKIFETVALLGPSLCLGAIPWMKCNVNAVVALLTTAMGLFGLCGGGDVSVIVDLTPDYAGKIFGVSNAIASIPGILSPVVAGYFLEGNKGDASQWASIFYISVGMYVFGGIVFFVFGSAEVQPWGLANKKRTLTAKEANLIFTVPVILSLDEESLKKDELQKKNSVVIEMTKL